MAADRKLAASKPLTVSLAVSASSQRRNIACAREGTLSLTVKGARLVSGESGGVMVFLNKPDATAATPPSDPHFAGAFDFFPANGPAQDFHLNLSAAFARAAGARRLSITLVVLPHPSGKGPSAQIAIGGLRLETGPAKP